MRKGQIKGNKMTELPDGSIEIELSQGQVTVIDKKDRKLASQYTWCVQNQKRANKYYVITNARGDDGKFHTIMLHRLIMDTPDDLETDHIDHDELNNRRSNLRVCTNAQNQMNKVSRVGSSSQYKGVFWNKNVKKWQAQIKDTKKVKYIGIFVSEERAAKAYDAHAIVLYGEFACLNFPLYYK